MIHHRSYRISSACLSWMDQTSPACRVKLIWSCMIRIWCSGACSEVSMLQWWNSSSSTLSHAVPVRWLCFGVIHTVRMKVMLSIFCVPVHFSIHQQLIGLEASTSPLWQTGCPYPLQDISDTTQRQAFQTTLTNSLFTWKLDISLSHSHPTNFLLFLVLSQARWCVRTVFWFHFLCSWSYANSMCLYLLDYRRYRPPAWHSTSAHTRICEDININKDIHHIDDESHTIWGIGVFLWTINSCMILLIYFFTSSFLIKII